MSLPASPTARALALAALSVGVLRCNDGEVTQLLVRVTTQPAEGLPVEVVEVEVQSEDALTVYDRARFPIVGAADGRFTLPLTFGVAPRAPSSGSVRVVARARLRDGSAARPLEATALTRFVPGQRLLLPLVLDYRCTLHSPCAAGQSCNTQECVSEVRDAATLRPLGPNDTPIATGSTCARPAQACIDRCAEGTLVPISRFVNAAMQTTLTSTPATPPCCDSPTLAARDVFLVSPTPRPDLLPFYICRATSNATRYSLLEGCEGSPFNEGILGFIVSSATPGRCGTIPLYRLSHPLTGDRYYTPRAEERDALLTRGYVFESIAGYVWPGPTERCGADGVACAVANGRPACTDGACGVASCNPGFADCDGDATNGCEADLRASATHCGVCRNACPGGQMCVSGACAPVCATTVCGGACIDTRTNPAHCGGCGRSCVAGQVCVAGGCTSLVASGLWVGGFHNCSLVEGALLCWGSNQHGQLGSGSASPMNPCAAVRDLRAPLQIFTSSDHTFALLPDGTVRGWGINVNGQLGDGTMTNRSTPVAIGGLEGVVELATGRYHSCARLRDGTVRCWGDNAIGELGDGTRIPRTTPTEVPGLANVAQLIAGGTTTCARLTSGSMRCWGENLYGQIGDGSTQIRRSPVEVPALAGVAQLSLGGGHACGLWTDGAVRCWGENRGGQLGDGTTMNRSSPVAVVGLSGVVQVRAGASSSCAVLIDGSVRCWGANDRGQIGDGTTMQRATPVAVTGLTDVVDIGLGALHACARRADRSVLCWGFNDRGQLSDGTATNRSAPVAVTCAPR